MKQRFTNLLRSLADARGLKDRIRAKDLFSLLVVIVAVGMLEVVGRLYSSELVDVASICVLTLVVAACVAWHRRWELVWTDGLWKSFVSLAGRLKRLKFQWGLDLRQEPPIPRGMPPLLVLLPAALLALVAITIAWNIWITLPVREVATHSSYVVYLLGAAAMWASLACIILVMAVVPGWMIADIVLTYASLPRDGAERLAWAVRIVYFIVVVALAVTLPTWVACGLLAVAAMLGLALPWLPRTWQPDCLWRGAADAPIRSMPLSTFFALQLLIVGLVPAVPIVAALGPEAVGLPAAGAEFPISTLLGRAAAWLCGCGMIVFFSLLGGHLFVSRWHDPARAAPTSLHVAGKLPRSVQAGLRQCLAGHGWQLRFAPRSPRRSDVCLDIADSEQPSTNDPATGRRRLSCAKSQLAGEQTRHRIERRDAIQRRRILTGGLQSIFRRAAARRSRAGCGYWVAPHYWFVDGLTRDDYDTEDTSVLDVIPPLYHRAIPRPARHHFFQVCQALQVDLIFVEDGVGFAGLRRVLRVMFERYDIDGGTQPLAEIHFAGLPKIRVMIHDYSLDRPLVKTKYPEPDYRHLGRVRILHIFRNRGEDDEQEPTPEEPEHLLSPVGSGV